MTVILSLLRCLAYRTCIICWVMLLVSFICSFLFTFCCLLRAF